jgi:hydrogenase nickel incorporation protein HypA/HybF
MHEMSLCEGILKILEENAVSQGFTKVKTIWLEIGVLSCVEPEAMKFSFEVISRGTLAAHACLDSKKTLSSIPCTGHL